MNIPLLLGLADLIRGTMNIPLLLGLAAHIREEQ